MSCSEVRSLLTLRSLDLLEEGERAGVESHLAGCATCRLELEARDDVAAHVREKPAFEKPPERVWDALVAKIDAGAAPAVATVRRPVLDLACAACSGSVESAVYCSSCLAPHHVECFSKCAVRGCRSTTIVSARPAPVRTRGVPLVLVGVAAIVMVGFMVQEFEVQKETYETLVAEATRREQLETHLVKDAQGHKPVPAPVKDEIDVVCHDEDLTTAVEQIGKKAGQNLVVDRDVKQKVSVELHRVAWRDAVAVLASLSRCEIKEVGSITVLFRKIEVPEPTPQPRLPEQQDLAKPEYREPEPPAVHFPDGRTIYITLKGVAYSKDGHGQSTAMFFDRLFHEGDILKGRDGNPLVPAVYVVKIQKDRVELASCSLDGPRATIEMGR